LLAPYWELPYAKEKAYALLDRVLGEDKRHPYLLADLVYRVSILKDLDAALAILVKYDAKYKELWANEADQKVVLPFYLSSSLASFVV